MSSLAQGPTHHPVQGIPAEVGTTARRPGPLGQNAMVQVPWAGTEAPDACSVLLLASLYFPRLLQATVLTSQEAFWGFPVLTQTPSLIPPGSQGEWGQVPALKGIYRQGSKKTMNNNQGAVGFKGS